MKAYHWESNSTLMTILMGGITITIGVIIFTTGLIAGTRWLNTFSQPDGLPVNDSVTQTYIASLSQTATQIPGFSDSSLTPTNPIDDGSQTVLPSVTLDPSITATSGFPAPSPSFTPLGSSSTHADWLALIRSSPTDGSYVAPGDDFQKTWTVKNTGTRTWTKDYDLVLFSGTQMTTKKVFPITAMVEPGNTFNLQLTMTAPKTPGGYEGNWMLRNEEGILFGLGEDANEPLKVKITVLNVNPDNSYDFLLNYCNATWWNGSGQAIYCESAPNYTIGFVKLSTYTLLETGYTDKPVLWVHPEYKQDGVISGRYPAYTVRSGDHFRAKVGCLSGYSKCNLTFKLMYRIVGGSNQTLGSWKELHDGSIAAIDIDLSFLAGKKVEFTLQTICNNNYPGHAHGFWYIPRIIKVEPTPTPTSSPTSTGTSTGTPTPTTTGSPTPTPTSATGTPTPTATSATIHADWLDLISSSPDDGSYFAPGKSFEKTWTVKNTGTSIWTIDYDLVFISGTQLTDINEIPIPETIQPGETIKLSVSLVSPQTPGTYQGFWMLRNDKGILFGDGENGDDPLTVRITVLNVNPNNSYDFLLGYCDAYWWNSSGEQISCNDLTNQPSGFVVLDSTPILEDGSSDKPVLWVHPEEETEGIISGRYPAYTINTGDHFIAKVGCIGGYPSCNITFKLLYRIGNNPVQQLETWQETYGGGITTIDYDLTPLAGQKVEFILRTICSGASPGNAQGFWMTPGIENIKSTATPTPIPTDIPPQ